MDISQAHHLIQELLDQREPPTWCGCVTDLYPRMDGWRFGLRWADEYHQWWQDFHKWEAEGEEPGKMPPKPKTPMYVPCEKCQQTCRLADGTGPYHDALRVILGLPVLENVDAKEDA